MMEWVQSMLSAVPWMAWASWILVVLLMVVGLAGTVLPVIPGHLLIFLGAAANKWLNPGQSMSWGGLALMLVLLVLAYGADFLSQALGTKFFGGSKWAIIGVLLGGLVGLFFGLPGLLIGPLLGAFVFEILFAKKRLTAATKSTVGTAVGTTVGLAARLVIGVGMVVWFVADVFYL
jgi:uncharacterized protein YqgC (DUF456 family)